MSFWDECQSPVLLDDPTFGQKKNENDNGLIDEQVLDQL
jgi:hypothetical protein